MKKIFVFIIFIITMWISSRALLHPHLFRTHDYVHGVRIIEMTRALQDGHFPVRWSEHFGYGYGMPLFNFYAPLPYYITSVIYMLSQAFHDNAQSNLVFASKMLWLIPNIVSFISMYILGKRLAGRMGGLLAAVAFTLAPYRAMDMFARGAISEVWGIMTFPLITLGIVKLSKQEKHGFLLLVLSLCLLMLSHNIMTMISFPFFIGLAFVFWLRASKKRVVGLKFILAFILSIGLTLFYTLPAVMEKGYTEVDKIFSGYFHYSQHFLYIRQFFQEHWGYGGSEWGPNDKISLFLGYGQLILFGYTILFLLFVFFSQRSTIRKKITSFSKAIRKKKTRTIASELHSLILSRGFLFFIFVCLFGFSLFMTLMKSKFIWDMLPPLQLAQFPWRFLSLSIFLIAVLNAYLFLFLKHTFIRKTLFTLIIIMLWVPAMRYFQPERYLQRADEYYYTDTEKIQKQMSSILPDYIPLSLDYDTLPHAPEKRYSVSDHEQTDILVSRTHEILISTRFQQETPFTFHIADFPGWAVFIDGEKVSHETTKQGLLEIQLPSGEHMVGAQFQRSNIRKVADSISFLSLFLLLCITLDIKKLYKILDT